MTEDLQFERADGNVICRVCCKPYKLHPSPLPEIPTMHRICDGAWPNVKWVKT